MTSKTAVWLLAGTANMLLAAAALAQGALPGGPAPVTQAQLDALQKQIQDLNVQTQQLKQAQADADPGAALGDLKRSTSDQYVDLNNQLAAQNKVGLDNGRLTVVTANGDFSIALRGLIQFDIGYFSQGRNPAGVDFNSGTNFRRAQLGFQGTVFRDWSYNFLYDFGGYGIENRGYVYNAYIEYDGLKPFIVRAGAYTPGEGQEDQTGSGDLFFPERPASVDVARNIAGAPSREAVSLYWQADNYLLSLSYTGKKTTDGTSTGAAVGTFDAQQALIGRAALLAFSSPEAKWVVETHLSNVFKLADPAASTAPAAGVIRFSNGPEVAVDASKPVDTGNIDAKGVREFGFETAGTYDRLYAQAGWFHYEVERRTALPNPHFSGWYGFATFSLTGEQHVYDPTTASFRNLKPAHVLGSGGWGAWELAARYSDIDLNFRPFTATGAGGIPGGKQDVLTLGLNWYPNTVIKFQLDYDNVKVSHPNATANNIAADAVVLRSQISL